MLKRKINLDQKLEFKDKRIVTMVSYDIIRGSNGKTYYLGGAILNGKKEAPFQEVLEWINLKSRVAQTTKSICILPR